MDESVKLSEVRSSVQQRDCEWTDAISFFRDTKTVSYLFCEWRCAVGDHDAMGCHASGVTNCTMSTTLYGKFICVQMYFKTFKQ